MAQDSIGLYTIKITDDTKEDASFSVFTPVVTLGNIVNMNTLATAFKAAVQDIILGAINQFTQVTYRNTENPLLVGAAGAARELNWVIQYKDTVTNKLFTFRIPAPDNADLTLRKATRDYAETTNAQWVAFASAFEAYALSEDGNAVEFIDAVLVGRNDRRGTLFP